MNYPRFEEGDLIALYGNQDYIWRVIASHMKGTLSTEDLDGSDVSWTYDLEAVYVEAVYVEIDVVHVIGNRLHRVPDGDLHEVTNPLLVMALEADRDD